MKDVFAYESEVLLKRAGLLATKQRILLLGALRKKKGPQSAEQITTLLSGKMNMTTVYRGLEQLGDAGLVKRLDLGKNHALFEFSNSHHHHVVCRTCGKIEGVSVCIPESVPASVLRKSKSFAKIQDHALEFFGTCKKCI